MAARVEFRVYRGEAAELSDMTIGLTLMVEAELVGPGYVVRTEERDLKWEGRGDDACHAGPVSLSPTRPHDFVLAVLDLIRKRLGYDSADSDTP